jgi:hypothetical protein
MPSIGRVGADFAGGVILNGCASVTANDLPVVRLGSFVKDHGINEHNRATMATAIESVTAEDIPVCCSGCVATCGHPLVSSSDVEVG